MANPKIKLMLDSGAFSAWKSGVPINLDDYIGYVDRNHDLLHSYVNLDVIPGKPGRPSTQTEVEEAAQASHRNLKRMHKAGLSPMAVFHFGESFNWLHRLLDEGEPCIGLGGLVGRPQPEQIAFLDRVFSIITNSDGVPTVRTHGFGIASFDLLRRYPFTTADATSWVMTAAMGSMYAPVSRNGALDFAQPPMKFTVSEVDRAKGVPPDHYLRFGPMQRNQVQQFLDEVGLTLAQVQDDYEARGRAIVYFMLQFQQALGPRPFRHRIKRLVEHHGDGPELSPLTLKPARLVFAGEGDWLVRVLVEEQATRWLRSYHFLKNGTDPLLAKYLPLVANRRMPKQTKRTKK